MLFRSLRTIQNKKKIADTRDTQGSTKATTNKSGTNAKDSALKKDSGAKGGKNKSNTKSNKQGSTKKTNKQGSTNSRDKRSALEFDHTLADVSDMLYSDRYEDAFATASSLGNRRRTIDLLTDIKGMGYRSQLLSSMMDRNRTYDNLVWAELNGGYSMYKDGGNAVNYGIAAGMDKRFVNNLIIGAYLAGAKTSMSLNWYDRDTTSFQVGIYGRFYMAKKIEIDFGLGQNYGMSSANRNFEFGGTKYVNYKSKFNTHTTAIEGRVGKVFVVNEKSYLKPALGFNLNILNKGRVEEGHDDPTAFYLATIDKRNMDMFLRAMLNLEYRMFVGEVGSSFYVTPGIERLMWTNSKSYTINVSGTSPVTVDFKDSQQIFSTLSLGGEIVLGENWSIFGGASVRASTKEQHLNGNGGVKFKW